MTVDLEGHFSAKPNISYVGAALDAMSQDGLPTVRGNSSIHDHETMVASV